MTAFAGVLEATHDIGVESPCIKEAFLLTCINNLHFFVESGALVGSVDFLAVIALPPTPYLSAFFMGSRVRDRRFLMKAKYTKHVYILTYSYEKY